MNKTTSFVIGNGPSKDLYQAQDGLRVVCNLAWHIDHDYISIIDPQPIEYINKTKQFPKNPIWVSPKAKRLIEQYQLPIEYECVHNSTVRYNNAQCVVKNLLSHGATTIHLYGCDTLWSEDMISSQDLLIPRPGRDKTLWRQWRKLWQEIFAHNTQVDYYIHSPVRVDTPDYGKNVRWHQHLII